MVSSLGRLIAFKIRHAMCAIPAKGPPLVWKEHIPNISSDLSSDLEMRMRILFSQTLLGLGFSVIFISEIMSSGVGSFWHIYIWTLCQLCILKVWIWQSFPDEHVRRDKPDVRSTAWKLQLFWFCQFILKFTWYVSFYQREFMLSPNLSVVDKIPPAGNISWTGT